MFDGYRELVLTSTASGGGPTPKPEQKAGGGPPPAPQTNAGGKPRPAQKPSSLFENNKDGAHAGSGLLKRADQNSAPKKKNDTDRVSKGSDDPFKYHNSIYYPLRITKAYYLTFKSGIGWE